MTAAELDALVWKWAEYLLPELRMLVLFAVLGLVALWVLVALKVADRVH